MARIPPWILHALREAEPAGLEAREAAPASGPEAYPVVYAMYSVADAMWYFVWAMSYIEHVTCVCT